MGQIIIQYNIIKQQIVMKNLNSLKQCVRTKDDIPHLGDVWWVIQLFFIFDV